MSLDVHPQLLRAFQAVLDTGSFTAASEQLGFTQSALSKQISALEAAAGVALFRRTPRGVQPTDAALRLARRAANVLDQLDAAGHELADSTQPLQGRVALGGFATAAMHLAPQTIAQVHREFPAVDITFAESSTPAQIRRLRAGRLDLAIIAVGDGLSAHDLTGIHTEPLPAGPLRVAMHRLHRLAHLSRIPVAELMNEAWIAGRGARGEPQFGPWPSLTAPHVAAHLSEWSTRLGFVAAGLGITTIPTLAAATVPADVVTIPVDDPAWPGRTLLLAHIGTLSPAATAVRTAVHGIAAAIATSTT